MAGINTAIQIDDRMSPVLSSITNAMNLMYSSFTAAQNAASVGIDAAGMEATRQAIVHASAAATAYQKQLERLSQTPAPSPPPAPTWQSPTAPEVFMNTGAERFAQEMQSANAMAQQLYQSQLRISQQAGRMDIVPPGMMNDMASISNRMQDLQNRVQELNNIPVELRTAHTNNEIEAIRQRLSQAAEAQADLSNALSRMDVSAANAAYQRLNSVVNSTRQDIRNNTNAQNQFNSSIQTGQGMADGLKNRIKQFVGMYLSVHGVKMAIQFIGDTTSLQNVQNEAETKLQTIMQQRMGASPQMVQGIKDLTSAQQQLGVVGDEVQLSGAQQLATFLSTDGALSALIPAMNNLAVQQNGVNVSAQDMVNIGNMMGKVMQGQVGALTRVGVTFTKAQEKALKYGNEQERAAVLAQVITDNVGNMNAVMANTPQGQLQQIANTWEDIKEVVGAKLYPAVMQFFSIINANMPTAQTAVIGLAGVLSHLITAFGSVVNIAVAAAGVIRDNWWWLAPVIAGVTAAVIIYKGALLAFNIVQGISNTLKTVAQIRAAAHAAALAGETAATFSATVAQYGFNAALLACPLTWVVIAIIAVIVAIAAIVMWIYRWVQSVGGLRIAWLICVNAMLTFIGKLILGFMYGWMELQNGIDNIAYGFASFKAGVLNVLGNLRAQGLMILQDFINGAIDMVNQLINTVNAITGAGISTITWTAEFGSKAVIEEAENRKQRQNDLANMKSQNDAAAKERLWNQMRMQGEMDAAKAERDAEISRLQRENAAAKAEKNEAMYGGEAAGGVGDYLASTAGNTGNTAANTAAMADAMDIIDEDLKYMRDAAEQEIINRFTLAELKLDISNNNTLTKKADFDDFGRMMNDTLAEFLASAAEGGHF